MSHSHSHQHPRGSSSPEEAYDLTNNSLTLHQRAETPAEENESIRIEMPDGLVDNNESNGEDEEDSDFSQDNESLREQLFYLPRTPHKTKRWYQDADFIKLCIMLFMVITYFFSELIVGILGKSLALLADAFHMLSDAISLFIGASAVLLAKKRGTAKYSYGFGRAETLGGLINSVFLLSAVLFIFLEAVERFGEPAFIEDPWLVLGVGTGGLLINVIGMIMFCGHAHGGHGHSHGGHGHSHGGGSAAHEEESHGHSHSHGASENEHGHSHSERKSKPRSHNMLGVFLHVFGDFLGSIGVLIAAILTLIFVHGKDEATRETHAWVMYVDPVLSVVLALLILSTAIPLVIATSKVLLQSVPDAVNIQKLREDLTHIHGVSGVHELHVWSVSHGKKLIGSVHLTLDDSYDMSHWEDLALEAKDVFHHFGIHSTTIQPEKLTSILKHKDVKVEGEYCNQMCQSDDCAEDACCPPAKVILSDDLKRRVERERNIRIRPKSQTPTAVSSPLSHDAITLESLGGEEENRNGSSHGHSHSHGNHHH